MAGETSDGFISSSNGQGRQHGPRPQPWFLNRKTRPGHGEAVRNERPRHWLHHQTSTLHREWTRGRCKRINLGRENLLWICLPRPGGSTEARQPDPRRHFGLNDVNPMGAVPPGGASSHAMWLAPMGGLRRDGDGGENRRPKGNRMGARGAQCCHRLRGLCPWVHGRFQQARSIESDSAWRRCMEATRATCLNSPDSCTVPVLTGRWPDDLFRSALVRMG